MKKKLRISTLILGIVIAVIASSNSRSFANTSESTESTELKTLDLEMLDVLEKILDEKDTNLPQDKSTKIYNSKSQLIYETLDKDDEHLMILLRRSDLVLQTDTSSYYLLGD
jgi:hypothetical protein